MRNCALDRDDIRGRGARARTHDSDASQFRLSKADITASKPEERQGPQPDEICYSSQIDDLGVGVTMDDQSLSKLFDKAIKGLWERRTFRLGDRNLVVACLIRPDDWRPLSASWWTKKQSSIIGADLDGNFFLRHCDGGVRHWDHKAQTDTTIARSPQEFLSKLVK